MASASISSIGDYPVYTMVTSKEINYSNFNLLIINFSIVFHRKQTVWFAEGRVVMVTATTSRTDLALLWLVKTNQQGKVVYVPVEWHQAAFQMTQMFLFQRNKVYKKFFRSFYGKKNRQLTLIIKCVSTIFSLINNKVIYKPKFFFLLCYKWRLDQCNNIEHLSFVTRTPLLVVHFHFLMAILQPIRIEYSP